MIVPDKKAKRKGEEALDVYESINPTVVTSLSQLTSELQQLIEWSESVGAPPETWGLNAVGYLGDVLKLRNPKRAGIAIQAAQDLANSESAFKLAPPAWKLAEEAEAAAEPEEEPEAEASASGGFSDCLLYTSPSPRDS